MSYSKQGSDTNQAMVRKGKPKEDTGLLSPVGYNLYVMRTKEKSKGYKLLTDQKGKKLGLVLTLKEYRELMEDLHDMSVVLKRKDEELVSLEDIKKEFNVSDKL